MTGYTRQSSASIIPGANITAAPLNAEFNQLEDAFSGSAGHAHDGSSGNGPKLDLTTSISGALPVANGGTNSTTAAAARTSLFGVSTTTDNALARYDGTTGALQNSSVTVDDSGNVAMAGNVTVSYTDNGASAGPILNLFRNSSSPVLNDVLGYINFTGKDSAANTDSYAAIWGAILDPTSTSEDGMLAFSTMTAGTLAAEMVLYGAALYPYTSDGLALGQTANMWSDLYLASGAVVNFNNGDVTVTHSANTLAFAGASSGYTFDAAPIPSANDGAALGTTSNKWSDVFLASGAVINFNSGNYTLTHSAGSLATSGALSVSGTLGVTGATTLTTLNTTGAVTVTLADDTATGGPFVILDRNSASPATNDVLGTLLFRGRDSGAATENYGSIYAAIVDPTATSEDSFLGFNVVTGGTFTSEMALSGDALYPYTSDGLALGSTSRMWSDLYLADGGVINWDNGKGTITIGGSNALIFSGTATTFAFNARVAPVSNDGAALGYNTIAWSDLFLASGAVINFNDGDVTMTHSSNQLNFGGANSYVFDNIVKSAGNIYCANPSGGLLAGTDPYFAVSYGLTHGSFLISSGSTSLLTVGSFYNPNGAIGSITINGSATAYNTSSDERLKENFQSFDSGSLIDSINTYKFDWKAGGSGYGVKAQEAYEVFPDAISPGNGEIGDEDFTPWSADYSKFVPLLLAEIKSLRARVAALEGN